MGTTTNFAWPYPAATDAPNGAAQMQALASAADTTVYGLKNPPRCVLERNTVQALTNATPNAIQFPGTEIADPYSMHSTGSNTSRIVVPAGWGGWYQASGMVGFTADADGMRAIWFRANGVGQSYHYANQKGVSAANQFLTTSGPILLAEAEYAELLIEHDAGASLDTANRTDGIHGRFSLVYLCAA